MNNNEARKLKSQRLTEQVPDAEVFILDIGDLCFTEIFDRCTTAEHHPDLIAGESNLNLGRSTSTEIILERAYTENLSMWDWLETVKEGDNYQFDASLLALDETAAIIAQWNLLGCWPSIVYTLPGQAVEDPLAEGMQERIVLNFENLVRVD